MSGSDRFGESSYRSKATSTAQHLSPKANFFNKNLHFGTSCVHSLFFSSSQVDRRGFDNWRGMHLRDVYYSKFRSSAPGHTPRFACRRIGYGRPSYDRIRLSTHRCRDLRPPQRFDELPGHHDGRHAWESSRSRKRVPGSRSALPAPPSNRCC